MACLRDKFIKGHWTCVQISLRSWGDNCLCEGSHGETTRSITARLPFVPRTRTCQFRGFRHRCCAKNGVTALTHVPPPPGGIRQQYLPPSDSMAPVTINSNVPALCPSGLNSGGKGYGFGRREIFTTSYTTWRFCNNKKTARKWPMCPQFVL